MLRVASRVTGKPENGITGKTEDGNPLRESRQSSRIKKEGSGQKQVQVPIHRGFRYAEHAEKPSFEEKTRFLGTKS